MLATKYPPQGMPVAPPPSKYQVLYTFPVPTQGQPRMSSASIQPILDGLRNQLAGHVAPPPIHKSSILLAASKAEIAEAEENQFRSMEETFYSARLRELATILFRELFGVRNELGKWVDGGTPRSHFLDWFEKTFDPTEIVFKLTPVELVLSSDMNFTPQISPITLQPASAAAKITARDLYTCLNSLYSVTIDANSLVHTLTVGDVLRLMHKPQTEQVVGNDAFGNLSKMVEGILSQHHTKYNIYGMDKRLQAKSFTGRVVKFHDRIAAAKMFQRVKDEWVAVFKAHIIKGLGEQLKDDGVLLTEDHIKQLAQLPAMKQQLAELQDQVGKLIALLTKLNVVAENSEAQSKDESHSTFSSTS